MAVQTAMIPQNKSLFYLKESPLGPHVDQCCVVQKPLEIQATPTQHEELFN